MATDSVTVSPTFNGDSVSLTSGMIVRLKPGANNNVVRAQADSAPHVQGVNGVVVSGSSAPTGVVTVVCTGRETVQMESALTPAVGDTVYVSPNVAGKGTNVLPAEVSAIGTIADVSAYAASKTVEVDVVVSAVTPASVSGVSSVNTTKPGDSVVPNVGAVIIKGGGIAEVDTVNTAGNMLSALNAANFPVGNTLCWVASVGAYFQLQISALAVDHITVETASGLAGAQWLRLALPNRAFWSIATWHVDPVNGSDEASGTGTGANALKTCAEWSRRLCAGSVLTATTTLNLDNDIPDADALVVACDALPTSDLGVSITGSQTVASTQTVASAQARTAGTTPGTGLANQIVVTGFDFSPYLNTFVRVQGTAFYAAVTKILTTNTANDTARLGELWDTTNNVQAVSGGITATQIIELVTTRKGPLRIIVSGRCRPTMTDVRQDGSGAVLWSVRQVMNGGNNWIRCIWGGTSASFYNATGSISDGGLCKSQALDFSAVLWSGTAFTGSSLSIQPLATYLKVRSLVFQGCAIVLSPSFLHIDGDLGQFDLGAGAIGIGVNSNGTGETSGVHFNSGRHYGVGNNATANMWLVGSGSYVSYPTATPPTMDAGNGVAINGGNVAIGSLPVNLSLTNGSAVYGL